MADDPFASIAQPVQQQAADPFADIAKPVGGGGAPEKSPGFFKQLMSPFNTSAEEFGEKHPVLGIPVRTAAAAAGAFAQTGPAVYHAFADPATEEEKAEFAPGEAAAGEAPGTQTSGLKRVGLGVKRLTTDPVVSAAKDYASGKVTPEAALSVLPEAVGVGIGSYAAGKVGDVALSKVGELRTGLKNGTQPFARKFTNVESALKDEVTDTAEKHGKAIEENKADRRKVFEENMRKQSQANFDIGREKVRIAEENKKIEAHNAGQEGLAAKRKVAEKLVDTQSVQLRERLGEIEEKVHKDAESKFDAVRKIIGNPEVEPQALTDSVKLAEKEDLQGIPENIKEFHSILGHGEEISPEMQKQYEETTGQPYEGPEPITWDKLQSLKSRIDARLRSRTRMNGDLKRALYRVQNAVVDTMGGMAEEHGAADQWQEARNAWRQYKQDFHEPSGPSGSGSPVAAALDAVDPRNVRQPFLRTQSTVGNRALDILKKYPQHGGTEAATLAEQMLKDHETMRNLPAKVTAKPLKEPKEVHDMPARKPAPPVPETPVVDANKVAREAISKAARNWGSFNARDVGILASGGLGELIGGLFGGSLGERVLGAATGVGLYEGGKYALSRALNNPKVIDWLAQTPPEETAALAKIPGADKIKIVDGITQQAINSGKPVRLSPAAKSLLGPKNVARILAIGQGTRPVQNRKDALDLLQPQ